LSAKKHGEKHGKPRAFMLSLHVFSPESDIRKPMLLISAITLFFHAITPLKYIKTLLTVYFLIFSHARAVTTSPFDLKHMENIAY
jgi:hypothetical protein